VSYRRVYFYVNPNEFFFFFACGFRGVVRVDGAFSRVMQDSVFLCVSK